MEAVGRECFPGPVMNLSGPEKKRAGKITPIHHGSGICTSKTPLLPFFSFFLPPPPPLSFLLLLSLFFFFFLVEVVGGWGGGVVVVVSFKKLVFFLPFSPGPRCSKRCAPSVTSSEGIGRNR